MKDHQKNEFGFGDFFHLDSIAVEHEGFNVISMDEFLNRMGKAGKLANVETGQTEIYSDGTSVFPYLHKVGVNPQWDPMKCIAAIPTAQGPDAVNELRQVHNDIMGEKDGKPRPKWEDFVGKPAQVDGPLEDRMREMFGEREELCIYDESLQKAKVVHFPVAKGTRLLTHFYAFIFFADWKAGEFRFHSPNHLFVMQILHISFIFI